MAAHLRFLKEPLAACAPSLEVMGITAQLSNSLYTFMRVIIPSQDPLVPRVGRRQINERVGIAPGCGIKVDIQEHGLAEVSSDFGPYQDHFGEETTLAKQTKDMAMPNHHTISKRLTSSANS
jgi:hypothetical protein